MAIVIVCTAIAAGCFGFVAGVILAGVEANDRVIEQQRRHRREVRDLTAEVQHLQRALDAERRHREAAEDFLKVVVP